MTKKKKPSNRHTYVISELKDIVDELAKAKTIQEMYIIAAGVAKKFVDIIRVNAEIEIEKAYREAAAEAHGAVTFVFGVEDRAAMEVITGNKVLQRSYYGIAQELSDKINKNIYDYYRNKKNLRDFVRDIKSEMSLAEDNILQIFRTETSHVSNLAISKSYKRLDPHDQKKYYWRIIHDHHTSDECLEIERIVDSHGGSVPLQQLENIIRLVTIKYRGPKWTVKPFQPHPNCRSRVSIKF